MKPLQWKPLNEKKSKDTVWEKVDDSQVKVVASEFEELFKANKVVKKVVGQAQK